MNLKVGDEFPWNRKGATLKVTEVTSKKVYFDVFGRITISGSMCIKEFHLRFLQKAKKLTRMAA